MTEYHKINSIFKRTTDGKTVLWGEYSQPEFEYLAGNRWVFTEKVDGTNIRVIWDGEKVEFRGKSDAAQTPWDLLKALDGIFANKPLAETFEGSNNVCLYGEGYGAGIQKGGVYRPDKSFVLFDVKVGEWWLRRDAVEDVASRLGLDIVPIIGVGTIHDMVEMTRTGFKSTWGDFIAEGIVARPECELRTRDGKRIITKIKHKDFK